ncbi:MAG: hypothetical protein H0W20_16695 [Chthoniobacterales bacterium]|nr:hypothetical protein [Chthoniobacterales bacterium]
MEIWRAATKDSALIDQLSSPAVAACVARGFAVAAQPETARAVRELSLTQRNTIVGEFAKRAMLVKSAGGHPNESHATVLFRQLTDYYVARDIAGYVGANFRCKTLSELRSFKRSISDSVAKKVQTIERQERLEGRNWTEAYPVILRRLQQP